MAFGRGLQLFGAACMGFSLAHAQNYRFSAVLCLDRGRRGRERGSPLLWNTVVVGGQEQQEAGVAVPFDPSKVTSHTHMSWQWEVWVRASCVQPKTPVAGHFSRWTPMKPYWWSRTSMDETALHTSCEPCDMGHLRLPLSLLLGLELMEVQPTQ